MKSAIVFVGCLLTLLACQQPYDAVKQEDVTKNQAAKATGARAGVNGIVGANWADQRDNFANDKLVLSGLTGSETYAGVQTTADKVLGGFQNLGINTVRLPLNPQTVSTAWWSSYQGAIDKALSRNMNVILAVWENTSFAANGKITDYNQFWSLWQTVVAKYGTTANVYFEPMNEPHGYSVTELKTFYNDWLNRFSSVPRGRIVLGGAGYCTDVNSIGSDTQFDGCLLGYHNYAFFNTGIQTVNGWDVRFGQDINYPSRTIITEFGCPMTTGKNYNALASDGEVAYLQAITDLMNNRGVAGVYWPGLRTNDSYSITTFDGTSLSVTNATGLNRLKYGWSLTTSSGGPTPSFSTSAYYRLVNRKSGQVLDVNQASTANGAAIIQWPYNGGTNQQWQFGSLNTNFSLKNRNSAKLLDVNQASTANGTGIIQYQQNNGANQEWIITDVGTGYYRLVNRNSGLALDVNQGSTANGASIIQWPSNGGTNQQWQIVQQ
ncbi:ricin-type beta-trefoil lectin protein [Spirosoma oryzae]|uniref:Ricin-type beta-trefoil lectin protein n=1 Tax=Spirosoma oryzae TaxID=1469603 RepID=A0A2T0T2M3_9BACT|nr:RICIN domain-containing protein [Spirosoma oryzae]PRY39938.1 ricin-type beta-trefoil lectin protein [Spirosoma oryzae]